MTNCANYCPVCGVGIGYGKYSEIRHTQGKKHSAQFLSFKRLKANGIPIQVITKIFYYSHCEYYFKQIILEKLKAEWDEKHLSEFLSFNYQSHYNDYQSHYNVGCFALYKRDYVQDRHEWSLNEMLNRDFIYPVDQVQSFKQVLGQTIRWLYLQSQHPDPCEFFELARNNFEHATICQNTTKYYDR